MLVRIGHINVAMAEIARGFPARPRGIIKAREWNRNADDLKKASRELIAAARKRDPIEVKKAAVGVNAACNSCHVDFR